AAEEGFRVDNETTCPQLHQGCKGGFDIPFVARSHNRALAWGDGWGFIHLTAVRPCPPSMTEHLPTRISTGLLMFDGQSDRARRSLGEVTDASARSILATTVIGPSQTHGSTQEQPLRAHRGVCGIRLRYYDCGGSSGNFFASVPSVQHIRLNSVSVIG